jgi:pSer/pThr/pTyr-binding forkhead associated (FHA) protein
MLVKLRVANGRHPGTTYNVWRWPYLIGRHDGASLRINNPRVSGRHCLLLLRGIEVWVQDAESTGGTLVNDEPLAPGGERRLSVGDRLTVGPVVFEVVLDPDPLPAEREREEEREYPRTVVDAPAVPRTTVGEAPGRVTPAPRRAAGSPNRGGNVDARHAADRQRAARR